MAAVLFCTSCGSHMVDVRCWTSGGGAVQLACCDCGNEQVLPGFTVARLGPTVGYEQAEAIAAVAISDAALMQGDAKMQRVFAERARKRSGSPER